MKAGDLNNKMQDWTEIGDKGGRGKGHIYIYIYKGWRERREREMFEFFIRGRWWNGYLAVGLGENRRCRIGLWASRGLLSCQAD